MQQLVVLLGGFAGTGKSTVAELLYANFPNCALVSADHLFRIQPFVVGDKLGRIKLRNCLSVIANYLEESYEIVICEGLVWSQAEFDAVTERFSSDFRVALFWFNAPREVRLQRVIARGESADFLEFADSVPDPWPFRLSSFEHNGLPVSVHRLDSALLNPEQIKDFIATTLQVK